MEVIVDGFIYQQQRFGGVSRIFTEILPRMCQLDPALHITMLMSGRSRQEPPQHPGIRKRSLFPIDDLLRPRRLWAPIQRPARRLVQQLALDSLPEAVWHSTYFTLPMNWNGCTVVTVYDMIYELFPEYFPSEKDEKFRQQKLSSVLAADKIICISATTRKDVECYYGIDGNKLQAIPLAYNQDFRQLGRNDCAHELINKKPFLLYIGRRSHYKNFKTLLQAYCVWQRRNEVEMLVVGSDWSEVERKWLADQGCMEQVRLLRDVSDHELACLYSNAAAFVYPSLYEGFGIPLLEAMACGCPIVASHIPSTMEVAGEQPFYFEAEDIDSLLEALNAALLEGRRPEKVESGIKRAQQYSWDSCAEKTLQVYHSLVDAG